jgi:hypothetical protein
MFAWRDYLEVHPAADLFPLMAEAELKELADDIRVNGLRTSIATCDGGDGPVLLDGRNRLDALAMLGVLYETEGHLGLRAWTGAKWAQLSGDKIQFQHLAGGDPYRLAIAFNIRRRHLNAQQRGEIVIHLLARQPDISDCQLGKELGVDGKTIARARSKGEQLRRIPQLEKTVGADGKARKRPAKKTKPAETSVAAETSAERMKQAYAADDAVDHVLRLVEQMTAKQRERLFLLLDETYSTDRLVTAAASAEAMKAKHAAADPALIPDDLSIPPSLRRTAP